MERQIHHTTSSYSPEHNELSVSPEIQCKKTMVEVNKQANEFAGSYSVKTGYNEHELDNFKGTVAEQKDHLEESDETSPTARYLFSMEKILDLATKDAFFAKDTEHKARFNGMTIDTILAMKQNPKMCAHYWNTLTTLWKGFGNLAGDLDIVRIGVCNEIATKQSLDKYFSGKEGNKGDQHEIGVMFSSSMQDTYEKTDLVVSLEDGKKVPVQLKAEKGYDTRHDKDHNRRAPRSGYMNIEAIDVQKKGHFDLSVDAGVPTITLRYGNREDWFDEHTGVPTSRFESLLARTLNQFEKQHGESFFHNAAQDETILLYTEDGSKESLTTNARDLIMKNLR